MYASKSNQNAGELESPHYIHPRVKELTPQQGFENLNIQHKNPLHHELPPVKVNKQNILCHV